ncbi:MAG TPA: hydrogenase maturation protease [bacterium]|nr:hydrogenase maturation protease [bacterium]
MSSPKSINNIRELYEGLGECEISSLVFVGLGNRDRGDDAAGLVLLDSLREVPCFSEAHFISAGRTPENHLQQILDVQPEMVVFLDAARWGGQPGEPAWLDPDGIDLAGMSTHAYSIRMIGQYLCAHGQMEVKYLGIQPVSTGLGAGISESTSNRIRELLYTPEK